MVVASLLDGRVRIRDEGLKREPLVARVREELLATPGVSEVEVNTRVGSLLVLYSAAVTAAEKILKTVSQLLGSAEAASGSEQPARSGSARPGIFAKLSRFKDASFAEPSVFKRRVLNNIGMLVSLVASLGAAIFGLKKLHILTGVVFLALFGDHFYQRRARMFA